MMSHNPILCAIDTTNIAKAKELTTSLRKHVGGIKLGLEFFTANGALGVRAVADQKIPIFLDLKFHDIPNTVAKAIKATAGINTFMTTVHTSGGRAMLKAAIDASMEVADFTGKDRPMIIGVTVLTSLDQDDISMLGFRHNVHDQVLRLADLAQSCGLDGVVCSPYEIGALRKACGSEFKLIVPGIRPAGSAADDQKRIMTPKEAVEKGADYLVIGRPITEAPVPREAAAEITKGLGIGESYLL